MVTHAKTSTLRTTLRNTIYVLSVFCIVLNSVTSAFALDKTFCEMNTVLYSCIPDCSATPSTISATPPATVDPDAKTIIPIFSSGQKDIAMTAIKKYKFGGMAMTGDGRVFDKAFFEEAGNAAGTPFTPMADEEGGNVARYGIAKTPASELGKQQDSAVQQEGERVGNALKGYGISVDLAPVVDIQYPGLDNHLTQGMGGASRAFGTNAQVVTEKAYAFALGLSNAGIISTFKHFPGLGQAKAHTDNAPATLDYNSLKQDTIPFQALGNTIQGSMVMLSNAMITGIGGGSEGLPGPINPGLVEKLRHDIGFQGTIITDDLAAIPKWGLPQYTDLPTIAADSLKAGADLLIIQWPGDETMDKIIAKIKDSKATTTKSAESADKSTSAQGAAADNAAKAADNATADDKTAAQADAAKTPSSGSSSNANNSSCCTGASGSSFQGGGDGGGCGEQGYASGKRNSKANKDQIWSFFKNKGLSDEATAGIMGNAEQESAFMPDALNSIGCLGFVQWCPRSKIDNFAKERGKDPTCLGVQLEFLWDQLTNDPYESKVKKPFDGGISPGMKMVDALNQIKNPGRAAVFFEAEYERSNVGLGENLGRDTRADKIYTEYTGKAPSALTGDSTGSASCPSSSDTSIPSADCASLVAEVKKLFAEGKATKTGSGGMDSLNKDLNNCTDGPIECGTNGGKGGVSPKILRAFVAVVHDVNSKGLGAVNIWNFNTGHPCDGLAHPNGHAVDFGDCYVNSPQHADMPNCDEIFKYIYDHASELGIKQLIHAQPLSGYSCNQGVILCLSDHYNEIHMGV